MADVEDKASADVPGELLANADLVEPEPYVVAADETEAEELEPGADDQDAVIDLSQLSEAEAVAMVAASNRPKLRTKPEPVAKKGVATPKRDRKAADSGKQRTTPVQFVKESVGELRKVVWPTMSQLQQYFVVVLVFVLIVIGIVSALDLAFGWALLRIFG